MSILHLFNTRYSNSLLYPWRWGKSPTKLAPLALMDYCETKSSKSLRMMKRKNMRRKMILQTA
jgi:hypothetical protein